MKKIAIFSENLLSNSGGAEIYALKLGEVLLKDFSVTFFTVRNKYCETRPAKIFQKYNAPDFNINVITFEHSDNKFMEIFKRIFLYLRLSKKIYNKFDLFINCSCNRMFGFFKTISIHVIHFPVQTYSSALGFFAMPLDFLYKKSYKEFWVNSLFTNFYLKKYWNCSGKILNPPIDMIPINEKELERKENIIIAVGRLVPDKKFIELINVFSYLYINNSLLTKYKLIIVGNSDDRFLDYFDKLKTLSLKNANIELYSGISYSELVNIYKKAKIFLHAKGFNVPAENPSEMEHFGMTTVEAMANGCVPIVINKAGQKESVVHGKSGFLWNSLDELNEYLIKIIGDPNLWRQMSLYAIQDSKKFLIANFENKVNDLLEELRTSFNF